MEDIKKEELNLTEEELEKISGGTLGETADDSRFLNVLLRGTNYYRCDRYGTFILFMKDSAVRDVEKCWASLGITYTSSVIYGNEYILNGQPLSREEAWAYAEKLAGRHLDRKDWDW